LHLEVSVRKNSYYDSVKLMQITNQVKKMPGVIRAAAIMGTENNKATLVRAGFEVLSMSQVGPNDVLLVVEAENKDAADAAMAYCHAALDEHVTTSHTDVSKPRSLDAAARMLPGANLALISVPGEYAAYEAFKALRAGMNVHIFSDNVPVDQEVRLKQLGRRLGLMVMGPDCGTAIIAGVPLGFANVVAPGPVGIVGASGTGIQQVSVLVDRLGSGVSHAIGLGGRDLTDEVGGIGAEAALRLLNQDERTKVIVLVSKPPGAETRKKIVALAQTSSKPIILAFLDFDGDATNAYGYTASNLEQAAAMAVALAAGKQAHTGMVAFPRTESKLVFGLINRQRGTRKYLRGLFCGGSLADEALIVLKDLISPVFSNIHPDPALKISAFAASGHTIIDMGDDEFTRGRPHPMIDPGYRAERLVAEWADPEVAVILCDLVLGYGSHRNPAGVLAEAVRDARSRYGEGVTVVASVCGTENDPQILSVQEGLLKEAGVVVLPTNAFAAEVAGRIISGISVEGSADVD